MPPGAHPHGRTATAASPAPPHSTPRAPQSSAHCPQAPAGPSPPTPYPKATTHNPTPTSVSNPSRIHLTKGTTARFARAGIDTSIPDTTLPPTDAPPCHNRTTTRPPATSSRIKILPIICAAELMFHTNGFSSALKTRKVGHQNHPWEQQSVHPLATGVPTRDKACHFRRPLGGFLATSRVVLEWLRFCRVDWRYGNR